MSAIAIPVPSEEEEKKTLDVLSVKTIPLPLPADTDFSLANIPFGVFTPPHLTDARHICTAIGNYILDLHELTKHGVFSEVIPSTAPHDLAIKDPVFPASLDVSSKPPIKYPHPLLQPSLNSFASLGRKVSRDLRLCIRQLIIAGGIVPEPDQTPDATSDTTSIPEWPLGIVFPMNLQGPQGHSLLKMHVPFVIGDYTDFYAGRHHAFNVGCLFRGKENALQPNYLHIPIGYHGRASTIICSEEPVTRPNGQLPPSSPGGNPRFGPSEKMDYELELAAFVGVPNEGFPIHVDQALDYIFGFVLMNDWSARDIQAWEYVPLGPFLGKSFATTISPWVVTVDALESFRVEKEDQGAPLLPYLIENNSRTLYDFTLEVYINPSSSNSPPPTKPPETPLPLTDPPLVGIEPQETPGPLANSPLTTTSPKHLIWSFQQMLAHHTINGCKLSSGDLLGSGTISGPIHGQEGSLLEMSLNGKRDVEIGRGNSKRRWLQDGDEVVFRGWGVTGGKRPERVGFGECRGRLEKAVELRY